MAAGVPDALIRALPKTDLHLHLDGSLRLDTILDLGHEQGIRPMNTNRWRGWCGWAKASAASSVT